MLDNGGQRHGARQLVIVLTDGKNNHGPTPVEEAKKLKDIGVTIITIGVGSNVDVTQLAQIASASDLVFHVGSFSTLFTIRENIVIAACQGKCMVSQYGGCRCHSIAACQGKCMVSQYGGCRCHSIAACQGKWMVSQYGGCRCHSIAACQGKCHSAMSM